MEKFFDLIVLNFFNFPFFSELTQLQNWWKTFLVTSNNYNSIFFSKNLRLFKQFVIRMLFSFLSIVLVSLDYATIDLDTSTEKHHYPFVQSTT